MKTLYEHPDFDYYEPPRTDKDFERLQILLIILAGFGIAAIGFLAFLIYVNLTY